MNYNAWEKLEIWTVFCPYHKYWKITTLFFFQLLNLQLEIESLKATYKNKAVSLHDVCLMTIGTNNNSCITQSIFDYWQKKHTNIDKIAMDSSWFFIKADYLDHFLYCTGYVLSFSVLHRVFVIISSTARVCIIISNTTPDIYYHFQYYTRYILSFPVLHEVCIIISNTTRGIYYHFQYYTRYVLLFPVLHKVCIIISSTTWGMCYHFLYYTRYVLSFLVLHEVCIIIK
jgi:hypothetical protein